jgi:hypothetical protein
VASLYELRDERSAENACGAGYENFHDCSSRLICDLRRNRSAARDSADYAARSKMLEPDRGMSHEGLHFE